VENIYDIFIIGGGINGAGISRDASGRGLKVGLADMGKVGRATSSWSTKLIHGGLRYLENYEFRLVRESLKEREVIKKIAPQITTDVPFVIPYSKQLRPYWMIQFGLFLYDNIGGNNTFPKSSKINFNKEYQNILSKQFNKGFRYFDLKVDDQKLVELNINDAIKRGAKIYENTRIIKCKRNKEYWEVIFENNQVIKTKVIINASGPWIKEVMNNVIGINSPKTLRLVKGSHIITNKIYDENVALTLQNKDKRIIFVIPYNENSSLIGTTEVEVSSPTENHISEIEIDYLINSVNFYLNKPISKNNILNTYSGIRPLIEDYKKNATHVSRDYVFDLNHENNLAPILNIFGGKLTTYRKLSENVMLKIKKFFPFMNSNWTHLEKL